MSKEDGRRSTTSDLNLTPQQQQVCLAPSFPLPCPTYSDTSQARLEAVLHPPATRKTLAWAMKTSKHQPQFLCNAQVRVVLPRLHERDPERLRDRALMWAGTAVRWSRSVGRSLPTAKRAHGPARRRMRLLLAHAVTAPPGVGTDAISRVHSPAHTCSPRMWLSTSTQSGASLPAFLLSRSKALTASLF